MFKSNEDWLFNDKIILKSHKDLRVIVILYILNKSLRLHKAVMTIRDYKHLLKLQHIHTEETLLTYAKARG